MKKFVGFDIETTGLDPLADQILEIGAIAFDETLTEIDEFHRVIHLDREVELSDFFLDMHCVNGLLKECYASKISTTEALKDFREWSLAHEGSVLFGRNVGTFDRVFCNQKLPGCMKAFSYRHLDLSSIRLLGEWISMPEAPEASGNHRALDDIRRDISMLEDLIDLYG